MSEFVPDEVLERIHGCFEGYPVMMQDEVRVIVAGVARAAQVAVLREMATKLNVEAAQRPDDEGFEPSSTIAVGYEWAAADLTAKADELEGGG